MPSDPQDTVIVVSERPIYTGAVFGGAPGSTGATGPVGATGPTGLTGATGATGLQGTAGTAGAAGAVGATGPTGLTGATGATGLQGTAGTAGAAGAVGATGPTGLTGATGATGIQGTAGTAGAAGAVGATGPTGLTGATGATGLQGTAGTAGAAGATGATANTWYGDSGSPSNSLGIDGDFYLDQSSGIAYKKGTGTPGQWALYTSLKGSNGSAGATGSTGATGSSYISEPTIDSWTYATGTASTGLTSGNFRLNSTTDASITTAYIHATALSSSARDALFTTTNIIGDVLYFRLISNPSTYLQFRISGTPTVASSIITVPVTYMSGDVSLGYPVGDFSISKYPSPPAGDSFRTWSSGKWYSAPANSTTNIASTLGTCSFIPVWVPNTVTLDRLGVYCTGSVAGAQARLGIYNNDTSTDTPGTLLLDAGQVAAVTNATFYSITIDQSLSPGLYWFAVASQGSTTPNLRTFQSTMLSPMIWGLSSASPGTLSGGFAGYVRSSVTGALPSPASVSSTTSTAAVVIVARTA